MARTTESATGKSKTGGVRASGATRRRPRQRSGAPPRRASGRLASARDRRRLDERIVQERERVERALAAAPIPLGPAEDSASRLSPVASPRGFHTSLQDGANPIVCPVCAGTQIGFDEVFQLGALRLVECLRCDYRWTDRGPSRWAEIGATMTRAVRRAPIRVALRDARAS